MSAYGDNRFSDENRKKISNEIDVAFASAGLPTNENEKKDIMGMVSALIILEIKRPTNAWLY